MEKRTTFFYRLFFFYFHIIFMYELTTHFYVSMGKYWSIDSERCWTDSQLYAFTNFSLWCVCQLCYSCLYLFKQEWYEKNSSGNKKNRNKNFYINYITRTYRCEFTANDSFPLIIMKTENRSWKKKNKCEFLFNVSIAEPHVQNFLSVFFLLWIDSNILPLASLSSVFGEPILNKRF